MMNMRKMTMTDTRDNIGEQNLRKRNRRTLSWIAIGLIFGLIVGFILGFYEEGEGNFLTGDIANISLDPAIAILIAIAFIIGLVIYPLYTLKHVDELEVHINANAAAFGGLAMLVGFPVWQVLAVGGLLPDPTAIGLFAIGFVVSMGLYIWFKIRA